MKRCLEFKYDVDPVAAACKMVRDMEKKAVSSLSPSAIHSPQSHHSDDVQAEMLVSSQQTLIFSCLSFVKYTYCYVSYVFGFPHPVNHVTDLNLHFTGLLFVGVFKNITPLKSESLLYIYYLSTSVFCKSIAVKI